LTKANGRNCEQGQPTKNKSSFHNRFLGQQTGAVESFLAS
jgi:hypothetical protein